MSNSKEKPETPGKVRYTSRGSELIIATEENTRPGKGLSENTKRILREKYQRQTPPAEDGGEKRPDTGQE